MKNIIILIALLFTMSFSDCNTVTVDVENCEDYQEECPDEQGN